MNKKVALASLSLVQGDKLKNISIIEETIKKLKDEQLDLIIFQELSIIGGMWKDADEDYLELAEEIPSGKSCKEIERIAIDNNISICVGITEKENTNCYITHFICGSNGYIGKQRKIFPHNLTKDSVFSSDKVITPIELFGEKIAILACADFLLPESLIMAGRSDATSIFSPTDCFYGESIHIVNALLKARAIDIGGNILGVFGNSYEDNVSEVLASIAFNQSGDTLSFNTKKDNKESLIIIDVDFGAKKETWGGFKLREKYLVETSR